jgi:RNA polymerase sigma-70 factor (ECF subfamily)
LPTSRCTSSTRSSAEERPLNFPATLEAAQAGGEWALAELFAEYQPVLLRYLRGRAPDIADDIASETWISAAQHLNSFEGDGDGFRAWLFTIARRRVIDQRRRDKRRPTTAGGDDIAEETASLDPSPEEAVAAVLAGDEAARRISSLLSPDQADVILLRVVGGLSVDEVANIMGKRPGNIRVLQNRGLRRLQKYL